MNPTALLRGDLLAGRVVAIGDAAPLGSALAALGAVTPALHITADDDEAAAAVSDICAEHGAIDALVHDLRPSCAQGGAEGLERALGEAWVAIRAVATGAFIPQGRGGRIALVAPPPAPADPSVTGARAAAENLARTLSVEWSRFAVTPVAITPGAATTDGELAALAAYLVSDAGAYFSGCRLALGEATAAG